MLGAAGDAPVGWCNYGETTHLAGVMTRFKLEAADHERIGSIACFVIAAPYRGHGVAAMLLDSRARPQCFVPFSLTKDVELWFAYGAHRRRANASIPGLDATE